MVRPLRALAPLVTVASMLLALWAAPARAGEPEEILTGLRFPAAMAFAPDGTLFLTEKDTGAIRIARDGRVLPEPFVTFDVRGGGETGLLDIALDPDFPSEPWLYVYVTDAADGRNRLVRIRAEGDRGGERETLLDALPAEAGYHNGGALAFDADGNLLVTIGEIHDRDRAQDPDDLGGKVLRLSPDGSVPADNPTAGSPVWSLGHRNSYGICVDPSNGDVWETENGPERDDEVNLIEPGANYGWPEALGTGGDARFTDPVLVFPEVIVPTGCVVAGGALWFGAYGDGAVRRLTLPPDGANPEAEVVATLPGGVLAMATGPDRAVYASTPDAVWRITGVATGTPSTASPASPASSPSGIPSTPDGGGDGWRTWVAVIAALVLVGGLTTRWLAGRRLRRDTAEGPSAPGTPRAG